MNGAPCPFCGGTRAFAALLEGDLAGALVLSPLLVLGIPALLLLALAWIRSSLRLGRLAPIDPPGWMALAAIAALGSSWIYVLATGRFDPGG